VLAVSGKNRPPQSSASAIFTIKVKNAQNAGAIGVIVGDNVAGGPPAGLAGTM
jgi:hypothetical protein